MFYTCVSNVCRKRHCYASVPSGPTHQFTCRVAAYTLRGVKGAVRTGKKRNLSPCIAGEGVAEIQVTILSGCLPSGPVPSAMSTCRAELRFRYPEQVEGQFCRALFCNFKQLQSWGLNWRPKPVNKPKDLDPALRKAGTKAEG